MKSDVTIPELIALFLSFVLLALSVVSFTQGLLPVAHIFVLAAYGALLLAYELHQ